MPDIITPDTKQEVINHTENPSSGSSFKDLNFLSLKGFFGLELPTPDQEEALNWIYDYYEKSGITDMADMLLKLKEVERKLGASPIGIGRESHVKNYLKIQKQIDDLTNQQKAYER